MLVIGRGADRWGTSRPRAEGWASGKSAKSAKSANELGLDLALLGGIGVRVAV